MPDAQEKFPNILNRIQRNRLMGTVLIVFAIAVSFMLFRLQAPLVWDDSPLLTGAITSEYFWDISSFPKILKHSFKYIHAGGYRPLSETIRMTGIVFFKHLMEWSWFWYFLVGIIHGIFCVLLYKFCKQFIDSNLLRFTTVAMVFFSSPFVAASWVVFGGIQVIVPLMFCLGLLIYFKILTLPDETDRRHKILLYASLIGVMFFGPWFREFIGLLPIIIIAHQVIVREKIYTITNGICLVMFLHALFPTWVIHELIYDELPVVPVFEIGHLGTQVKNNLGADCGSSGRSLNSNRYFF